MKLRVMLIDQNQGRAAILNQALTDAGYVVAARYAPGDDLAARVDEVEPDVIIIDMDSPDRDTLESMHSVHQKNPRPVVMFAQDGDRETINAAVKAGVSAYVVDDINRERVRPIVDVAVARFREFQALRDELQETKDRLADRKDIERAKGILMKQRGFDEDGAYQALRKMAMDRNKRLAEVARDLIAVAEMLV